MEGTHAGGELVARQIVIVRRGYGGEVVAALEGIAGHGEGAGLGVGCVGHAQRATGTKHGGAQPRCGRPDAGGRADRIEDQRRLGAIAAGGAGEGVEPRQAERERIGPGVFRDGADLVVDDAAGGGGPASDDQAENARQTDGEDPDRDQHL
jgi:hypothetical protein